MALPSRLSKTHVYLQKLIQKDQPINPNGLLSRPFTKPSSTSPLSTHNPNNPYLSPQQIHIADDLISVFVKQPFSPESSELKSLAPFLTTKLVESVLSRFTSWETSHRFFSWASQQIGYRHNCYTYNVMGSILSGARRNAELRALSSSIVHSNCSMTPGGLGFFLRCLGSLGLTEEANTLFDEVKRRGLCVPNDYSYSCLLEVLSKSGSVDLAELRLKEMTSAGFAMTKFVLTPLLQAYCNVGRFEDALKIYDAMIGKGWVDAHVFTILIVSFSKWGDVDKALELIQTMEGYKFQLHVKTFYVLINGFVKQSRLDEALHLFGKMRKLGLSVDVSLFTVLIGGLSVKKQLEKAVSLYEEMKNLGIRPDSRVVETLVRCCSSEADMIRLLEENEQDIDNDEEVMLCYDAVLSSLVNSGSVDKAYLLLEAMMGDETVHAALEVNKPLKVKAFHMMTPCFKIVIDGLLKRDKLDTALGLFNDMIRIGCSPGQSIYNNLIDGLCISNRLEDGYEILKDMENRGLEPTEFAHNSLYWCHCRREDIAGAFEVVKRMRTHRHKPWAKHSSSFVAQLCESGKVDEARSFLDDLLQEGVAPNIVSYSAVLDCLVKAQDMDQALDLFKNSLDRGCCPDVVVYNIVINGLCMAHRISEAESLANDMVTKGLDPSIATCNLLVDGWCKVGDMDRAMACLSNMFSEQRNPNVITYTTLISGFCAAGRPGDAVLLFDEMRAKGCSPNRITFAVLISGLCLCGEPDTALSYLRKMEERQLVLDGSVYVALIRAFLADSNVSMAFEILREIVDKRLIPDQQDENHSLLCDAIRKLLADETTSQSVKALIATGSLPTLDFFDVGNEDEQE